MPKEKTYTKQSVLKPCITWLETFTLRRIRFITFYAGQIDKVWNRYIGILFGHVFRQQFDIKPDIRVDLFWFLINASFCCLLICWDSVWSLWSHGRRVLSLKSRHTRGIDSVGEELKYVALSWTTRLEMWSQSFCNGEDDKKNSKILSHYILELEFQDYSNNWIYNTVNETTLHNCKTILILTVLIFDELTCLKRRWQDIFSACRIKILWNFKKCPPETHTGYSKYGTNSKDGNLHMWALLVFWCQNVSWIPKANCRPM